MNPDFDCNRLDEGIISDSVTRVMTRTLYIKQTSQPNKNVAFQYALK